MLKIWAAGNTGGDRVNPLTAKDVLVAMLQHGHKYALGGRGVIKRTSCLAPAGPVGRNRLLG